MVREWSDGETRRKPVMACVSALRPEFRPHVLLDVPCEPGSSAAPVLDAYGIQFVSILQFHDLSVNLIPRVSSSTPILSFSLTALLFSIRLYRYESLCASCRPRGGHLLGRHDGRAARRLCRAATQSTAQLRVRHALHRGVLRASAARHAPRRCRPRLINSLHMHTLLLVRSMAQVTVSVRKRCSMNALCVTGSPMSGTEHRLAILPKATQPLNAPGGQEAIRCVALAGIGSSRGSCFAYYEYLFHDQCDSRYFRTIIYFTINVRLLSKCLFAAAMECLKSMTTNAPVRAVQMYSLSFDIYRPLNLEKLCRYNS